MSLLRFPALRELPSTAKSWCGPATHLGSRAGALCLRLLMGITGKCLELMRFIGVFDVIQRA